MLALLSLAAAAPPGYQTEGTHAGCELALGPDEADGVVPMWAACEWPEVSPDALAVALDAPERYVRIWANVLESRVIGRQGGMLQVRQRHDLPAFADREVVVDWRVSTIPGGRRYTWTTSTVDWDPSPDAERCVRYEARWDVTALPGGGARVVHETRYASGTLPAWLVRPFLGRELTRAVAALRAYVGASSS
jgi:hypothetical protein